MPAESSGASCRAHPSSHRPLSDQATAVQSLDETLMSCHSLTFRRIGADAGGRCGSSRRHRVLGLGLGLVASSSPGLAGARGLWSNGEGERRYLKDIAGEVEGFDEVHLKLLLLTRD